MPHERHALIAGLGGSHPRAVLPDARVGLLPGQGHMATVTAPELVAGELARFLSG
jgi:pimeloyl-ACP methyl ester carboxylesterase